MIDNEEQLPGQMSMFDFLNHDTWSGKTSQAHFQVPEKTSKERTSEQFSKKPRESSIVTPQFLDLRTDRAGAILGAFWEIDGVSLGEFTTHSFGESPKCAVESRLSQILEDNPHPKYSLSAKACMGILKRASRKGKDLPPILKDALIQQVTRSKLGGGAEIDSAGKKAGKGALVQEELSGTLGVSQDQTLIKVYSDSNDIGGVRKAYSIGNGQVCGIGLLPQSRTLDCMHDQQAILICEGDNE